MLNLWLQMYEMDSMTKPKIVLAFQSAVFHIFFYDDHDFCPIFCVMHLRNVILIEEIQYHTLLCYYACYWEQISFEFQPWGQSAVFGQLLCVERVF